MTGRTGWQTVSDTGWENVRRFRKRNGWSVTDLAERCIEIGEGAERLTAPIIENIEHGRRRGGERTRNITVDELMALAYALAVPPAALMPNLGDSATDMYMKLGSAEMIRQMELLKGFTERQRALGQEMVRKMRADD